MLCNAETLVAKLTVDYESYPTFRKDKNTKLWGCGSPRSTYEVERIMFGIIYKVTYGIGVDSNDKAVEDFRSKFLKVMKRVPGRLDVGWCYNITDEDLNIWCSNAIDVFYKLKES